MWAAIIIAVAVLGRWAFTVDTHAQEGDGTFIQLTPAPPPTPFWSWRKENTVDCSDPGNAGHPICNLPTSTPRPTETPPPTKTPKPSRTPRPTSTPTAVTGPPIPFIPTEVPCPPGWTRGPCFAPGGTWTPTNTSIPVDTPTPTHTPTPKATAIQGGPTSTFTPTPDPSVPTNTPVTPTATPTPRPGQPSPSFLFDAQILYEQTKPIQDATQTHWSVLHWADVDVQITNAPGSTADPQNYSFTLQLNSADTGFYVATVSADCGPSSWTFTGPPGPIRLIRCGLGSTSNTGMKITAMLNPSGPTFDVMSTGRIEQGWHRDDLVTSYYMDLASLDGSQQPGFNNYTNADRTQFETEIDDGAAEWNRRTSRTVFQKLVLSSPPEILSAVIDVHIKGYWYEIAGHCGPPPQPNWVVLGCTTSGVGTYPHVGLEQPLWLKFPPGGMTVDSTGNIVVTEWTTSLSDARKPEFYYLPQIVKHELGHSAGLGHLFIGTLTMSEHALVATLQTRDVDAMKEVTNPH